MLQMKCIHAVLFTALTSYVSAVPTPLAPAPGDVFNEGALCTVSWAADSTGLWKVMNIELMAGPNSPMQLLTTVGTVDGTDQAAATFSYPCPIVSPNSPIYFYQFTSPADPANVFWTGRFAIADATGATTPPPNATQPTGEAIPWGNAVLGDGNTNTTSTSSSNSTTSTTSSNSTASTLSSTTSSSASAATVDVTTTDGASSTSSSAGPSASANAALAKAVRSDALIPVVLAGLSLAFTFA